MHDRCWLNGLGWFKLSSCGSALERSIVDRAVSSPERLVFEAPPRLKKPLKQDQELRQPIVHDGKVIDTLAACPPLTTKEQATVDELKAAAKQQIKPQAERVKRVYVEKHAEEIVKRTGVSKKAAVEQVESRCRGVLQPEDVLMFVDKELEGCTVADVLGDPKRFERRVLADPIEGVDYGATTAMVLLRRSDGHPWIKSFAHGGMSYTLGNGSGDGWSRLAETLRELKSGVDAPSVEFDIKPKEKEEPEKEKEEPEKEEPNQPKAYFLEELQQLPIEELQWIVDGFILARSLNGLFGDGGVGKDYLLLELAIAMACGAQWLGHDVKQGKVMYFPVEDDIAEIRRRESRITGWYQSLGTCNPVAKQLKIVPMVGSDTVLAAFDHANGKVQPTPLFTTTCKMISEFAPDLVIVGNRVNIFSVNQNDDASACQCMALLTSICTTFGAGVIMPSHTSLRGEKAGDGTSGSVQWNNACRMRTFLRRIKETEEGKELEPDPNARQLEVMKANYSSTGQVISLYWNDGLFKPDPIEVEQEAQSVEEAHLKDEQEVLRLLDRLLPGDYISPKHTAPNNAGKRLAKEGVFKRQGKSGKQRAWAAIGRLIAKEFIESVETGPPSRRIWGSSASVDTYHLRNARNWTPSNSPSDSLHTICGIV